MKKIFLSASKDMIFSMLGLLLYNGVMQLVVYPYLNDSMGAGPFGTALYILSVVSIMGSSFGSGASYSRMVAHSERIESNGDYNRFLLQIFALSVPVSFVTLMVLTDFEIGLFVLLFFLMVFSVCRYYADVQFRMTIRFKEYFLYLVSLTVGNLVGLGIFRLTDSWIIGIMFGEILALIFVVFTGSIFRKPFLLVSDSYHDNMKSVWTLSISNLVSNFILNSDRILIRTLIGASEVTVFYTATLIGKMVAMFTSPLNGIIISYLTGYKIKLDRKRFSFASFVMFVMAIVITACSVIVSEFFVRIMYPNVYDMARDYFIVANAGQVFYFMSGSLMVIVLKFTKENMQLIINICHLIVFALLAVPGALIYGLSGLAYGLLAANLFRFVLVVVIGLVQLGKAEE